MLVYSASALQQQQQQQQGEHVPQSYKAACCIG
jgi:hypothetical protein